MEEKELNIGDRVVFTYSKFINAHGTIADEFEIDDDDGEDEETGRRIIRTKKYFLIVLDAAHVCFVPANRCEKEIIVHN